MQTNLRIPLFVAWKRAEKGFLNSSWILNIFGESDPFKKKSNVLIVINCNFFVADERLITFKIWDWIKFLERIVSNKIEFCRIITSVVKINIKFHVQFKRFSIYSNISRASQGKNYNGSRCEHSSMQRQSFSCMYAQIDKTNYNVLNYDGRSRVKKTEKSIKEIKPLSARHAYKTNARLNCIWWH